jgi:ectoine hydroxylase-related dioxygenase (phytanoyl-CoA dioxygenase family)
LNDTHADRLKRDGYTIVEDAVAPELIDALSDALVRLERDLGVRPAQNSFEGRNTVRIYNLLALDPVFAAVPAHPAVLPLVEGVLDEGCLVSSLSSIAIDPGESEQPIHADDQVILLEKPHAALVCNSMWALTDFTEANGATRLVPLEWRALARGWRKPQQRAPHGPGHELLCRLHPPAGEPTAGRSAGAGADL